MEVDIPSEQYNSDNSDLCDINEINETFVACKHMHVQSLGPKYILHISATKDTNPYIAAALSDKTVDIFTLGDNGLQKVGQLKEHSEPLVDCKFDNQNDKLLYTGSNDGTIKLWDLRQSKGSVMTFADTTVEENDSTKILCSFDVSCCSRLLAAGTELTDDDAYILFWDVRNNKLMGAYWESHSDDITQVKFHKDDSNKIMSGSTDCLINTYDLSQPCEDDALQECLNTDALVEKLAWFEEGGNSKISCITSTFDLQLWETDGAEPYTNFSRDEIANILKTKSDNTYLVNVHKIKDSLVVLAGSNGSEGKTLRSFEVSEGKGFPAFRFDENEQRVRASWLNENVNLLLTGGENGKLNIWKPDLSTIKYKSKRK